MRVIIAGDFPDDQLALAGTALSAAHNKRRISLLMYSGGTPLDNTAERWANENGVLCATLEANGIDGFFAMADSVIAFPATSEKLISAAVARGLKVWQPYKHKLED